MLHECGNCLRMLLRKILADDGNAHDEAGRSIRILLDLVPLLCEIEIDMNCI